LFFGGRDFYFVQKGGGEFHKHREVNMRIRWKFRLQYGNESSVYFQSSALRFCGF